METRKINLTPSLLRDDSNSSTIRSVDTKEVFHEDPLVDSLLLILNSHSGRDQALIPSTRFRLLQVREKTTKAEKKRKGCSVVFSSERIGRDEVKMKTLTKVRRRQKNYLEHHRNRKTPRSRCPWSHQALSPQSKADPNDRRVNFKKHLHQELCPASGLHPLDGGKLFHRNPTQRSSYSNAR